jgi:hypothetical protein
VNKTSVSESQWRSASCDLQIIRMVGVSLRSVTKVAGHRRAGEFDISRHQSSTLVTAGVGNDNRDVASQRNATALTR